MDSNTDVRRPRCGWEQGNRRACCDRCSQNVATPYVPQPAQFVQPTQSTWPAQPSWPDESAWPMQSNRPAHSTWPEESAWSVQSTWSMQSSQPTQTNWSEGAAWPMQPSQSSQPIQTTWPAWPSDTFCPQTQPGMLEQNYSVAMAYVPWQQWQSTYAPERGLQQGTIFPDLDLRFDYGGCIR